MRNATTNLKSVRSYNERLLLQRLREDGTAKSRAQIAREMGLPPQTVANIAKRLLDDELLAEVGKVEDTGGKPGVTLKVNPDGGYAIGVQIDQEKTTVVIMNLLGEVPDGWWESKDTPRESPSEVLELIRGSVEGLVDKAKLNPERILGIGVAFPGPVNYEDGSVNWTHLVGWDKQYALKAELEKMFDFGYEITVENDATAASVAEFYAGEAAGCDNFCFVYMGAGVGAGLFIDGRPYRAVSAGEFGHIPLDPINGPECWCGGNGTKTYGCVEQFAKPATLEQAVKDLLGNEEKNEEVTARLASGEWKASTLVEAYERGVKSFSFEEICRAAVVDEDPLALWALRDKEDSSATMLGHGVAGLVNVMGPELIVLGGWGVEQAPQVYEKAVYALANARKPLRGGKEVPVKMSAFSEKRGDPPGGALGAASMLLYEKYAPRI